MSNLFLVIPSQKAFEKIDPRPIEDALYEAGLVVRVGTDFGISIVEGPAELARQLPALARPRVRVYTLDEHERIADLLEDHPGLADIIGMWRTMVHRSVNLSSGMSPPEASRLQEAITKAGPA